LLGCFGELAGCPIVNTGDESHLCAGIAMQVDGDWLRLILIASKDVQTIACY
jgi:hypothetical protein